MHRIFPGFYLLVTLMAPVVAGAQDSIDLLRRQVQLMVVPMAGSAEKGASDPFVIAEVQRCLQANGYGNIRDTERARISGGTRSAISTQSVRGDIEKIAIENTPADILIEVGVVWTDPPGKPQNRQASLRLKATDPYSGDLYAVSPEIRSRQRQFPDLSTAVKTALTIDDVAAFKQFLASLDQQIAIRSRSGDWLKVKFEISVESMRRFTDVIGETSLGVQIARWLQGKAAVGAFRTIGEGTAFLDYKMQLCHSGSNAIDDFRQALDRQLAVWQIEVKANSRIGNWINVIIQ